ncbi:MAG: FAD-dependent oxidoreductase, partial [Acidothermus cellulolyticus]|nr:FAD-dependent oxidoreductase [Acidothermus cellulolyticus]
MTARIVVVGGGIAGLSAAFYARRRGFSVTVLEGSKRFGGKLLRAEIAGVSTDLGAEALLARRPEAVDLAREVGLGGELVPPATTQAAVYSRGRLRPLPAGHVMGVPRNLRSLAATGIVPPTAVL